MEAGYRLGVCFASFFEAWPGIPVDGCEIRFASRHETMVETMLCWHFTGGNRPKPGFLRWCEVDFATTHGMSSDGSTWRLGTFRCAWDPLWDPFLRLGSCFKLKGIPKGKPTNLEGLLGVLVDPVLVGT